MRLTPQPLEDLDNPDRYESHDTFGTSSVRRQLSNLVGGLEGHGVIVVDGPWGSGKTTFTKMWTQQLRANGHTVVSIDAFEVDHNDDAFLPMILKINNLLKLQEKARDDTRDSDPEDSVRSRLLSMAENISPLLRSVSVGIPMGGTLNLGLALDGVIELKKHGWGNNQTHKVGLSPRSTGKPKVELSRSPDMNKSEFYRRLDRAAESQKAVRDFKNVMREAVKQLTGPPDARLPLVFVIDELDRCMPRFALQVLERMKHLFSVDGICFILVTHLPELAAMIKHEYGLRDPDRYLDKFYHISVDIDRIHAVRGLSSDTESMRQRYVRHLRKNLGFALPTSRYFRYTLRNLIDVHGISLRSVERVMVNLGLYQSTAHCSASDDLAHFAAALCVMKVSARDLFRCAAAGSLTFRQAMEFLRIEEWSIPSNDDGTSLKVIKAWWWLVIVNNKTDESYDELQLQISEVKVLYRQTSQNNSALTGLSPTHVLRQICMDLSLFTQP